MRSASGSGRGGPSITAGIAAPTLATPARFPLIEIEPRRLDPKFRVPANRWLLRCARKRPNRPGAAPRHALICSPKTGPFRIRPCGRILERWRFLGFLRGIGHDSWDSDQIRGRGLCRQRWMRTIGRTRLRCSGPACPVAAGKPRTIAASSRRFISSPSRTFAGARYRSASVLGTACGSASIV